MQSKELPVHLNPFALIYKFNYMHLLFNSAPSDLPHAYIKDMANCRLGALIAGGVNLPKLTTQRHKMAQNQMVTVHLRLLPLTSLRRARVPRPQSGLLQKPEKGKAGQMIIVCYDMCRTLASLLLSESAFTAAAAAQASRLG